MCQAIGHPVIRLHRSAYGFLTLEGLEPEQWRTLSEDEVKRLRAAASRAAEGTDEAPPFRTAIEKPLHGLPRADPRSSEGKGAALRLFGSRAAARPGRGRGRSDGPRSRPPRSF